MLPILTYVAANSINTKDQLESINNIMFRFILNERTYRIRWTILTKYCANGGLQMIDLGP